MSMSAGGARLEFQSVHKSYSGGKKVLRGFTASFVMGRIAALVGPNGAGKTTLLRIAAGLQSGDAGAVTRDGQTLYYGGFDLLPTRFTINRFRRALGLPPVQDGARQMSKLSRGELQRCGLEASLERCADILLLDEPWTALEPDAREELNARLRRIVSGAVVLCASHDLDEVARIADDVIFLADGEAVWQQRSSDGKPFQRDDLIRTYRKSRKT